MQILALLRLELVDTPWRRKNTGDTSTSLLCRGSFTTPALGTFLLFSVSSSSSLRPRYANHEGGFSWRSFLSTSSHDGSLYFHLHSLVFLKHFCRDRGRLMTRTVSLSRFSAVTSPFEEFLRLLCRLPADPLINIFLLLPLLSKRILLLSPFAFTFFLLHSYSSSLLSCRKKCA